jgi:hypothetical protein
MLKTAKIKLTGDLADDMPNSMACLREARERQTHTDAIFEHPGFAFFEIVHE